MNEESVLFLDVDGVLNSDKTKCVSPSGFAGVSSNKVKLLRKLIDTFFPEGVKIVLSSTWRLNLDDEDGDYLKRRLWQQKLLIYDVTPNTGNDLERGLQIKMWLKENPDMKCLMILDDESFEDIVNDRELNACFVKTDSKTGLTQATIENLKLFCAEWLISKRA